MPANLSAFGVDAAYRRREGDSEAKLSWPVAVLVMGGASVGLWVLVARAVAAMVT